jgi:hypothetical protein
MRRMQTTGSSISSVPTRWAALVAVLLVLVPRQGDGNPIVEIGAFLTIVACSEQLLNTAQVTQGHPDAEIELFAIEPQGGLHVGEHGVINIRLRIGFGTTRGGGTAAIDLATVDHGPHGEIVTPLRSWSLEQRAHDIGLHYSLVANFVPNHPGYAFIRCRLVVNGFRSAWPMDLPVPPVIDQQEKPIRVDEPYRVILEPPDRTFVYHGEKATGRLDVEVLTQADGEVVRDQTRLNGKRAEVWTVQGNAAAGQSRRQTLITTEAVVTSCIYGPADHELGFSADEVRILVRLPPDERGAPREPYVFWLRDRANLPVPVHITSRPQSCALELSLAECRCARASTATRGSSNEVTTATSGARTAPKALPTQPEGESSRAAVQALESVAAPLQGVQAVGADPARDQRVEAVPKVDAPSVAADDRSVAPAVLAPTALSVEAPRYLSSGRSFVSGGPFDCESDPLVFFGSLVLEVEGCECSRLSVRLPSSAPVGLESPLVVVSGGHLGTSVSNSTLVDIEALSWPLIPGGGMHRVRVRVRGTKDSLALEVVEPESCTRAAPREVLRTTGGERNEASWLCASPLEKLRLAVHVLSGAS